MAMWCGIGDICRYRDGRSEFKIIRKGDLQMRIFVVILPML